MMPLDPAWLAILGQISTDPNQFNNYLVLGFVVMLLIGMVYIVSLLARQRNIQQDIRLLRQILQEDEDRLDR